MEIGGLLSIVALHIFAQEKKHIAETVFTRFIIKHIVASHANRCTTSSTIALYNWSLCISGKKHYNTHAQVSQNDIVKDTLDLREAFRLSRGIPRRRLTT